MFLNLHSHSGISPAQGRVIRNINIADPADLQFAQSPEGKDVWLSAGIHPWNAGTDVYNSQLNILQKILETDNVKLLGECGLDRLKGPDLRTQQKVFREQIALAGIAGKPVLIHCVRCFSELLVIKKELNLSVPMIVHGFNNNQRIADQLLEKNFFLSFGPAVLVEGSNAGKVLSSIPADHLFLETDDKDMPIERVYEAAAGLLNISLKQLKEVIFANYLRLENKG